MCSHHQPEQAEQFVWHGPTSCSRGPSTWMDNAAVWILQYTDVASLPNLVPTLPMVAPPAGNVFWWQNIKQLSTNILAAWSRYLESIPSSISSSSSVINGTEVGSSAQLSHINMPAPQLSAAVLARPQAWSFHVAASHNLAQHGICQ